MTGQRYIPMPRYNTRIARGDDFASDAWFDTESKELFRVVPNVDPNQHPGEDMASYSDHFAQLPLGLTDEDRPGQPCLPWPPTDEDFDVVDRVSREADYF